jgi:hypothetical protein
MMAAVLVEWSYRPYRTYSVKRRQSYFLKAAASELPPVMM